MLFLLAVPVSQAADCSGTSTRLTPLNDPFFQAHHGFAGGLYPDRSNQRPAGHEQAGLRLAEEVRPRNAQGAVDDQNGKIVFLSIGMSNTTQEFSVFKRLADQEGIRGYKESRNFYKAFMETVRRYGRTNEVEIMVRYFLTTNPLLAVDYVPLALAMLRHNKVPLSFPKVAGPGKLDPLFARVEELEEE